MVETVPHLPSRSEKKGKSTAATEKKDLNNPLGEDSPRHEECYSGSSYEKRRKGVSLMRRRGESFISFS